MGYVTADPVADVTPEAIRNAADACELDDGDTRILGNDKNIRRRGKPPSARGSTAVAHQEPWNISGACKVAAFALEYKHVLQPANMLWIDVVLTRFLSVDPKDVANFVDDCAQQVNPVVRIDA